LIVIGSAVPAVLFGWVGGYDAVTVAALSFAVLSSNRAVATLGWLFAGLNNAPLALIAYGAVAIHRFQVERVRAITALTINAGGLLVGIIGIQLLLRHWGVSTSRLGIYNDLYSLSRFTTSFGHYAPLIVLGGLGVGWIVLGSREVRSLRGGTTALITAGILSIGIPLIALDQTRVLSFVGFALVLSVANHAVATLPTSTVHQIIHRMLPAAVLVVIPVVWDNQLLYAGWSSTRVVLRFLILGH
jgi:hypothetical protein